MEDALTVLATQGEVVAILDQLKPSIDTLDLSADDRRRAQEQLARARDVFSRDGGGDPGAIKKGGAAALERLWDGLKRADLVASIGGKLVKLAPFLDVAADKFR